MGVGVATGAVAAGGAKNLSKKLAMLYWMQQPDLEGAVVLDRCRSPPFVIQQVSGPGRACQKLSPSIPRGPTLLVNARIFYLPQCLGKNSSVVMGDRCRGVAIRRTLLRNLDCCHYPRFQNSKSEPLGSTTIMIVKQNVGRVRRRSLLGSFWWRRSNRHTFQFDAYLGFK